LTTWAASTTGIAVCLGRPAQFPAAAGREVADADAVAGNAPTAAAAQAARTSRRARTRGDSFCRTAAPSSHAAGGIALLCRADRARYGSLARRRCAVGSKDKGGKETKKPKKDKT
jgi:hypothetical protein